MSRATRLIGLLLLLALPAPILIVIGSSVNPGGYIKFPPDGVSFRWYLEMLTDPRWPIAFATSLFIAAVVSVIVTVVAFFTSYYVQRYAPKISLWLELLILSPMFFPHAAMGVGLVALLAWAGLLGVMPGIILAHLIVALPFAYRPVHVAMRSIDPDMIRAASVLGASEARVLKDVIWPMCRSGVTTSLLFAGILSFDEVTITMFLVGPQIKTLPVQIYAFIQDSASPVLSAISTVCVVLTFGAILLIEKVVGLSFFVRRDEG